MTSPFNERQTRLIYEALDNNNPKQALTLCQKSLKKQPDSGLFKALLALTASSVSKFSQANELMNGLLKEDISDLSTLEAMGSTLRKLDRDNESADCYEKAFNTWEHEELGVELFFSSLKAMSFKRCHLTALKLYKRFGNFRYYLWSTISMYNLSQFSERAEKDPLSVQIVEKMVKKALAEGKLRNFQEYSLCLLISDKDEATIAELLRVPENVFPTPLDCIKWKVNILAHLDRSQEIVELLRALHPTTSLLDDWELMMSYFNAYKKTTNTTTSADDVIFWDIETTNSISHKRAHYLALIELETMNGHPHRDNSIQVYFSKFGEKESCFADLVSYLKDIDSASYYEEYITRFLEGTLETSSPQEMTALVACLKIQKYLAQLGKGQMRLDGAEYYKIYCSCSTEAFKASDVLILAVVSLIETFNMTKDISLLYQSTAWLIQGIASNELNFYLKLLLIVVLRELGGVTLALQVYESLNIKNIQLDMLSYLVFDWIPIIGFPETMLEFCNSVASLYESNAVETPLMLIEAYRYGSYSQIPEFIDFYLQLKHSIQRKITEISRIQVQIVQQESKQALAQFFQNLQLPHMEKTVMDNRPHDDLFSTWGVYTGLLEFTKKNGSKDTSWLETCYAILVAMKSCYGCDIADSHGPNGLNRDQLEALLKDLNADSDEKVDPLLRGLLAVVYAAYHRDFKRLFSCIAALIEPLETAVAELTPGAQQSSEMTPDTLLVKLESIVEIIHYATVFSVGASYCQTGSVDSAVIKALIAFLQKLLCIKEEELLPIIPEKSLSYFVEPSVAVVPDALLSDWKRIWSQSKVVLESCQRILRSLLPR